MQITLEVPEQFGFDQSLPEIGCTLKLYAALALFQAGKLSVGAAIELAGVDRYTFMATCKQHNIATINYSANDLAFERANYKEAS